MSEDHGISTELADKIKTKYSLATGMAWVLLYLVLACALLIIARVGNDHESRGFWIETGVALGLIGLAMMGLQALFSGRFKFIAPSYGMDNILQFHKEIGIVATLFVLGHPIMLIASDLTYLEFFDPRVNLMRAIALIFVSIAIPAITITSLWRPTFGLSYERWRLLHGFLGVSIVFVGIVHSIQVSHFFDPLWKKIAVILLMGACMYLVAHTRIVRPHHSKKRPYRVHKVDPERGEAFTIQLVPEKGDSFGFIPGQFIWMTLGPTPFSLQQHPFSISSGARDEKISITAKGLGDFTSTWGSIDPGTKCFIEGPFGSFTPIPGADLFLIMGGIGITPAMSMLRTMRDEGDRRKATLIYANSDPEGITFREEIDALSNEIDLTVVHVLDEMPQGWPGTKGRVDHKMIGKHLPGNKTSATYYICGPGGLMDAAEEALRVHGVPWEYIYSERFEIV